ncbi:uncharacterized protein BJ171DRAFT_517423 [Polychytrium aggregatum]|uniref:uncharacterized protein n=1 Tax=Polychytrium aggregatum TaxID=110093 RepID=UPI0022FEBF8B|nr:uncharacterized protein BJ171DRAFT_517423 [Polychytrium aggregatum]KAI9199660.1 hypothetical protein BJ171DRAFT_517423 [Polychytrium aggregatum]
MSLLSPDDMSSAAVVFLSALSLTLLTNRISQLLGQANAVAEGVLNPQQVEPSTQDSPATSGPALSRSSKRRPFRTDDALNISALGALTRSSNINTRESAVQILLNRAISEEHLSAIVAGCNSSNPAHRQKCICAIQLLAKPEENRQALIDSSIPKLFTKLLKDEPRLSARRDLIITLFRLISGRDKQKIYIARHGILAPLIKILKDCPSHNTDLKYWALLLLHQLSLCDDVHAGMIKKDIVSLLATLTRLTFGNTNMQKMCLHSLVRLITSMESQRATKELNKLLDMHMVSMIALCLKNDDMELIYWTVFLMHEFVVKDIARSNFCQIKGLIKVLSSLLTEDALIPRIVLRTLKCLAYSNESFQKEMIQAGVLKKIVPCISSDDQESQYWALVLIHGLLSSVETREEFVALKGLDILLKLSEDSNLHISLYITDILVYLCSTAQVHEQILNSDIMSTVLRFCEGEDDLKYAGAALMLNLIGVSDTVVIKKIEEADGISVLTRFVLHSERENIQTVSAKTLCTIARKDEGLAFVIMQTVVGPLIQRILKLGFQSIHLIFPSSFPSSNQGTVSPTNSASSSVPHAQHHPNTAVEDISPVEGGHPSSIGLLVQAERAWDDGDSDGGPPKHTEDAAPATPTLSEVSGQLAGHIESLFLFMQSTAFSHVYSREDDEWHSFNEIYGQDIDELCSLLLDFLVLPMVADLEEYTEQLAEMNAAASAKTSTPQSPASDIVSPATPRRPTVSRDKIKIVISPTNAFAANSPLAETGRSPSLLSAQRAALLMESSTGMGSPLRECVSSAKRSDSPLAASPSSEVGLGSPAGEPTPADASDSATANPATENQIEIEDSTTSRRTFSVSTHQSAETANLSEGSENREAIKEVKEMLATNAMSLIRALFLGETHAKEFLLRERWFNIVGTLLDEKKQDLVEQSVMSLSQCVEPRSESQVSTRNVRGVISNVIEHILTDSAASIQYHGRNFIAKMGCYNVQEPLHLESYVRFSLATRSDRRRTAKEEPNLQTENVMIDYASGSCIRNDAWTFESVKGNHGIQTPGKWAYEVVLKSNGIIQIGWANMNCHFEPECGTGVGDCSNSYGYEGQRCKKWHGVSPKNNDYGEPWEIGDIITCVFDYDQAEISYYRNGASMGVAFTDVDKSVIWYPALSLASYQECEVHFGDAFDPFTHNIESCMPVAWVLDRRGLSVGDTATVHTGGSSVSLHPTQVDELFTPLELPTPLTSVTSDLSTNDTDVFVDAASHQSDNDLELSQMTPLPPSPSPDATVADLDLDIVTPVSDISVVTTPASAAALGTPRGGFVGSPLKNNIEMELFSDHDDVLSPDTELTSDIDETSSEPTVGEPAPPIYFEVKVGLRGLRTKRHPQIGIIDMDECVYMALSTSHRTLFLIARHPVDDDEFFDSRLGCILSSPLLTPPADALVFPKRSLWHPVSEQIPPEVVEEGIEIVGIFENRHFEEASVVGCYLTGSRLSFTLNGKRFGPSMHISSHFLSPYYRNLSRWSVNVGQASFKWDWANQPDSGIAKYASSD